MSSMTGNKIKISVFGQSHSNGIGVVIDGLPAGKKIDIEKVKDKIKETAERLGFFDIILCEDLKEAVAVCAEKANPGEAVLLSPACASWGMFDNYEQRGRVFKDLVRNL